MWGLKVFILYFQFFILSCDLPGIWPGSLQINLFVHRQADTKPGAVLITFEHRRRWRKYVNLKPYLGKVDELLAAGVYNEVNFPTFMDFPENPY